MKKLPTFTILTASLLAATSILTSCAHEKEPFDLPVQVSLEHYAQLRPKLSLQTEPAPRDSGVKQLQAYLDIQNLTNDPLRLEYRLWFTDRRGETVEEAQEWQHLTLDPHQAKGLRIQSVSFAAKDFRIIFRERH